MSEGPDGAHPKTPAPSPHGEAALLLVESLIHGLAAKSVLTVQESVSVLEVALEAQTAIAQQRPSGGMIPDAGELLASLLQSLRIDLPVGETPRENDSI